MLELLSQMLYVLKWFIFDFTIQILTIPLGAIGEFLDAISITGKLVGILAAVGSLLIAIYKKYS